MCPQCCERCQADPPQPIPPTSPGGLPWEPACNHLRGCDLRPDPDDFKVLEPLASWEINPQSGSRLFGSLPSEIRLWIFEYALTPWIHVDYYDQIYRYEGLKEYPRATRFDFRIKPSHDGDRDDDIARELPNMPDIYPESKPARGAQPFQWFRPGCVGRSVLSIALLQTCRRAFLEARRFVLRNERCYWWNAAPTHPMSNTRHGTYSGPSPGAVSREWGQARMGWERQFKTCHFFGTPIMMCNYSLARDLRLFSETEHVKCTTNSYAILEGATAEPDDGSITLHPFGDMKITEAMERTKNFNLSEALAQSATQPDGLTPSWMPPGVEIGGRSTKWHPAGWSKAFFDCNRLQTFTWVVDVSEERRAEAEAIVGWASRTWNFPLDASANGGFSYLSADGNPVERMSWRGQTVSWQDCRRCNPLGIILRLEQCGQGCEEFQRRKMLFRKGLGPRMYSWTIKWTRRTHPMPNCTGKPTEDG